MREKREERDTTMHFIKIQVLPTLVVLLNLAQSAHACYHVARGRPYITFTRRAQVGSEN